MGADFLANSVPPAKSLWRKGKGGSDEEQGVLAISAGVSRSSQDTDIPPGQDRTPLTPAQSSPKCNARSFMFTGCERNFIDYCFLLTEINYLISTPRESLGFVFIKRKNKQNSTEMF